MLGTEFQFGEGTEIDFSQNRSLQPQGADQQADLAGRLS
jgi:hypothetical protein